MIDRRPQNFKNANDDSYALYPRGIELLENGELRGGHGSARPGRRARSPEVARSARRSAGPFSARGHFAEAATEFEAIVEAHPTNDFAHFCLGRALDQDRREPTRPATPRDGGRTCAPTVRDYRIYRQRLLAS